MIAVAEAPTVTTTGVPRLWPGATVVCLGGGPSLTPADVDACRGRARVIAINDAYRLAPWADVLYGCDGKWWKWHQGVPSFEGLKFAMEGWQTNKVRKQYPDIHVLKDAGAAGLSTDPTALCNGRNSGYQAINLAVLLGASRVLLLGYDMRRDDRGRSHWFGEHPDQIRPPFSMFVRHFAALRDPLRAAGVTVLNCSRHTVLQTFPRVPLEEALA